jgi:hypothetical protein
LNIMPPSGVNEGNAAFHLRGNGERQSGTPQAKNLWMGKTADSGMRGWVEIGAGVALAIAAEPIHELGHAMAVRLTTGAWPEVGFWAVHPTGHFESTAAILAVLAAGEAAVIGWWGLMYVVARARPHLRWALIGPTFMAALGLLNWLAAAILSPIGLGEWGASDAVKFMAVSRLSWILLALVAATLCSTIAVATWRCLASQRAAD